VEVPSCRPVQREDINSSQAVCGRSQFHPDFSIASVEGAVPFSRAAPASLVNTSAPAPSVASSAASALPVDSVDRLQAELIELRRTVARLEEGRR